MKSVTQFILTGIFVTGSCFAVQAQSSTPDSTGYPGDNFSLKGALYLFEKSSSPEDFEKKLNTRASNVNNLDLNKDGQTDYVRVVDKSEKKAHIFILQVPVSKNETRDIAVIELEKTGDTTAVIQIIGDSLLYGRHAIIEPNAAKGDNVLSEEWNSASSGPAMSYSITETFDVFVNVWYWPSVAFVYGPVYTPWVSPWRWGYYPSWWITWRPIAWTAWYPACAVYSTGYVSVNTFRATGAHYNIYTPYRYGNVSVNRQAGVVTGPNGAVGGVRTTVTGPNGHSATRTTVGGAGRNGAFRATGVRKW